MKKSNLKNKQKFKSCILEVKIATKINVLFHQTSTLTLLCILKDLLNKSGDFFHWCNWDFLQVAHLDDKVLSPSAPLLHHKTSFPITKQFYVLRKTCNLNYVENQSVMEVQLLTGEYLPTLSLQCRSYKWNLNWVLFQTLILRTFFS